MRHPFGSIKDHPPLQLIPPATITQRAKVEAYIFMSHQPFQQQIHPNMTFNMHRYGGASFTDRDTKINYLTTNHLEEYQFCGGTSALPRTGEDPFNTLNYSFPMSGQISQTPQIYTQNEPINLMPLQHCNNHPYGPGASSQENFGWSIPEPDYYTSNPETSSPHSGSTSSTSPLNSPCSSIKDDGYEGEPKKRRSSKKSLICDLDDCNKSFKRTAELVRHQGSVHRETLNRKPILLPCKYPGCARSGENGFKRKDNYMQHLRGPHNEVIPKRKRGRASQAISYTPEIDIPQWSFGY